MSDGIPQQISVVPEPSEKRLNRAQLPVYEEMRTSFIEWLETEGKDPDDEIGYAFSTIRRTAADIDMFFRWVWDREGGFTTSIGTHHGDAYLKELEKTDSSGSSKANKLKSLKRFFRWRDSDWEPETTFSGDDGKGNPQDWLSKEERAAVRQAALELGSVPDYGSLDSEQINKWKHLLAERFRKPKSSVSPSDFERANGFKIPSIVWVSLDAGFRPIEVGRAKVRWCDTQNARLLIPKDDDSKGKGDNWSVVLNDDTNEILKKWLAERETYPRYEDSDRIWLTREGRQYSSRTLNYLFDKLLAEAEIQTHRRNLTWYSMRHSTGTYITNQLSLKSAAQQLRHTDTSTTERYDHPDEDEQRDALDNIE